MSTKKPFCLFKKKLANGQEIYYYTVYDYDGKRRQFSTGSRDQLEAYQVCLDRLKEGTLIPTSKIMFKNYTKLWFTENCPYYTPRTARGGNYSKSSIENKHSILIKHILPVFGEMRMDFIQTIDIENWLHEEKKAGYAVNSINQYLAVLRLIFNEALRLGIVRKNPVKNVLPYKEQQKEKGMLTAEESRKLFDQNNLDKVWGGDLIHFYLNYVSYITGMRQGECLALTASDIEGGFIHIKHSWDRKHGLKGTKSGKERYAPIPSDLAEGLKELSEQGSGRFLFRGQSAFKPVNYKTVQKNYVKALKAIGITDKERKARRISFHSYRHAANTRMKESGMPEAVVRSIIGHSSSQISDHYTHIDPRGLDLLYPFEAKLATNGSQQSSKKIQDVPNIRDSVVYNL
jgi:integrase